MTTKEFIEKAKQGGWDGTWLEMFKPVTSKSNYQYVIHRILLDPLAWQAVGKVEGWQGKHDPLMDRFVLEAHMNQMVYALVDGKTIEEFLETRRELLK